MATNLDIELTPTLEVIDNSHAMAVRVLEKIREKNIVAEPPRVGPTFTISQAAAHVGRSASAIRMAEQEGRLPHQDRNEIGRRQGYTLKDLDHMRKVFDTRPWRAETDVPAMIAVQNFKGGVGKSTLSVHLAQYLAIKGYRVLLVDADAQASATMMFGYIPDQDIDEDGTIATLLAAKPTRGVRELIRKTHYHNLDLIPANLHLYNAEYEVAARMPQQGAGVLGILGRELYRVADHYDVIIMDPPPALGMVSLSVLQAANALVIPMPPSIIDFASTTSFLSMLRETMASLSERGMSAEYGFIHMVLSKSDTTQNAQAEITDIVKKVFGRMVLDTSIRTSAEFGNASARLQSVYDLSSATTNHSVRSRCLSQINSVGREIERHIYSLWESKAGDGE